MVNPLTQKAPEGLKALINFIALLIFLPLLVAGVIETTRLITRASGTPATIVIDTKKEIGPIRRDFWHAFAQGGEEAGDMIGPVIEHVKKLDPILIRMDHIYDHYDVVSRSGNDLIYDFSRLDAAVNTILSVGAKPVLALSYMPSVIAQGSVIINPPNDWNEWAKVVERTIAHYSGQKEKNITNVYYEVWNEPDLDQFGKWTYSAGPKSYMDLYRYASIGANNAKNAGNINAFYLGGPATTGLYKNWIEALVGAGYRLDFLSWHTYLVDPVRYRTDMQNLYSWLLDNPGKAQLPKLITEFGITGAKDARYGTAFTAAHTAAVIRQLVSGGPTYAFSFQLKDGPNQEGGADGWGIIGHEDQGAPRKPRYAVFNFLDAMEGTRLQLTGEGTWVTSFAAKSGNIIRVMLVNFDLYGSHVETTPITFTNLDPGNYTYRVSFSNGNQQPVLSESVTSSSLTKQLYMPAQSVAIAELTKL